MVLRNSNSDNLIGAHASGFAGAELKRLQRITGLDPAGYKHT